MLAGAPARADSGSDLVRLVNAYRAAPGACQGRPVAPVGPLAPHRALAKARIGPGILVQYALEQVGYAADHAEAIHVSGTTEAASVMSTIRQKYCNTLLSARFTAAGAVRTGVEWTLVLAQPSLPIELPDWPEAGKAVLAAVNAARAIARVCGDHAFPPAPPLEWDQALGDVALAHSSDMASNRFFSHKGNDGSEVDVRAERAGYRWQRIGENIASGRMTPEDAVAGWLASPGHCANIMSRGFSQMGAAYVVKPASRTGTAYWTQVLASPR
jgi:uncharacterized protein YkwD